MNIYDKTITLFSKLKGADNTDTKKDEYFRYTLHNCGWYNESISSMSGTNATMSHTTKIFIPFTNKYTPYREWVHTFNKENYFTLNPGDIVVLGEVEEVDITVSNITSTLKKYEPYVCNVKNVRVLERRLNNNIELYVEGV